MEFSFTIKRGDVILRAKDETYLTARTCPAEQMSNKDARYEMQADERDTHERKLLAALNDAVAGLKAELNEYLINGDVDADKDAINLTISVSDSFRSAERKVSIATLAENYITKRVISEWWVANFPEQAGNYVELAAQALEQLKRAFYFKGEAVRKSYGSDE